MTLPIRSFDQLVDDQVAAVQAVASQLIDFSIGSILRAVVESNAGNSLWLQALVTTLLAVTRLSTSSGNDVDTFIADFGLTRNPPVAAEGKVTFSRFTPTAQAIVPALNELVPGSGTQVSAPTAFQTYTVIVDTLNPYFDPNLTAYVIPPGTASVDLPVRDNAGGAAGNVITGLVNTLNSTIIGVDTVVNNDPMVGGKDEESDSEVKIRFVNFINGLSKATFLALSAAIEGVPGVARFELVENVDFPSGNPHLGFFYAIIDDGTGNPPSGLLDAVSTVLNATRAFTIAYAVYPPTLLPVVLSMTLVLGPGGVQSVVTANVKNALVNYINNVAFATTLPYTKIAEIAYLADSNILNVKNLIFNGGTSDITPGNGELFQTNTSSITISY